MLRNALTQLRANVGRVSAAALAIVLGVAFIAATLTFTGTMQRSVQEATAAPDMAADLVVNAPGGGGFRHSDVDKINNAPGVAAAEFRYTDNIQTYWPGGDGYASAHVVSPNPRLHWFTLAEGKLPGKGNEVALDATAAESAGLGLGSTITAGVLNYDTGQEERTELKVTGLVDTGQSAITGGGTPALFASPEVMQRLKLSSVGGIDVLVEDGVDATTARQSIATTMGPGYAVQTGEEKAQQAIDRMGGGMSMAINATLLPFAAIALFVAGFVIVNTFSILLAQRSRQYALLRCVGATRSQIRRSALLEALVTGVIASIIGTGLGIFVAAIVGWPLGLTDSPIDFGSLGVSVWAVIVPPLVGVLVTLLAALAPAARATRVAPLAALRPVIDEASAKRIGLVRLVFAVLLMLLGFGLLGTGAFTGTLGAAVPGALLASVGVLLFTPSLIPAVAKMFGVVLRSFGPTGSLATGNAVRNPYRAASTSTALMIGVGLIVLLMTSTATAQVSAQRKIDEQYPVDAMLTSKTGALPPDVLNNVRHLEGVHSSATLKAADIQIKYADYRAFGLDPAKFQEIARHGGDVLRPGTVLVNPENKDTDLRPGQSVTIPGRGGQVTVRVVHSDLAESEQLIFASSDLAKIEPQAEPGAVWLRAQDNADLKVFVDNLSTFFKNSGSQSMELTGAAPMRSQVDMVLNVLLAVVTGLLGVAVIIAVVGIANTLGLSVLERGRESALLRALGLTRGQLRGTLAVEAVLLALVGAVLGIALGVVFAWAGAMAVFGQFNLPVALRVPVGQILLVLGCAVAAGVGASVLPARRAAKAAPAAALSDE